MPLSEDFDALRLHLVSAVPQFWADRGHYSYLETSRSEAVGGRAAVLSAGGKRLRLYPAAG